MPESSGRYFNNLDTYRPQDSAQYFENNNIHVPHVPEHVAHHAPIPNRHDSLEHAPASTFTDTVGSVFKSSEGVNTLVFIETVVEGALQVACLPERIRRSP